MAVTFTNGGWQTAASGASPLNVPTATAYAVGDYLVALMAYDNSGGGGADPMSGTISLAPATGAVGASVSAQTGLNDPGAASTGLAARCVAFPVTTAIPTSTQVAVSWSGTVVVRAIAFMKVSSNSGGIIGYRTNSGAALLGTATTTPNMTTPSINNTEGVLCWAGYEYGGAVIADADTVNGSWSSVYGVSTGSTTSGMAAYFQSKVVTATATQSWTPTSATASDWLIGCLIFTETPVPAITQAAYQWFDEGTESGAVALAAQNTAVIGQTANGDATGTLRIRLQSTTAVAVPATDDWQLQWEKNASGSWTNVVQTLMLVDSYPAHSDEFIVTAAGTTLHCQSFLGTGQKLTQARFYLKKFGAPPTGTISAMLFDHTGTFGNGQGSSLLASSSTIISSSVVGTTSTLHSFEFDGTYTLQAGTPYVIGVEVTNSAATTAANCIGVGGDLVTLTHAGNHSRLVASTTWAKWTAEDLPFEVYTLGGFTVSPYDSPNLTNAQATTSRLTGGTGSFVAGKVSEDALMDNLGWAGNSYTELVYALKVYAADVVDGDALRFRVLRNNSTSTMTYSVTPTITIKGPVPVVGTAGGGSTAGATAMVAARPLAGTATGGTSTVTGALTVLAPPVVTTKTETLTDTFDTEVDTATKWPLSLNAVWEAGRAKVACRSDWEGRLRSAVAYDLIGSRFFAKVTPQVVAAYRDTYMYVHNTVGNWVAFAMWTSNGGELVAEFRTGGAGNYGTPVTYDPVAHAWWQIRESGGTVYFETSPDSVTWNLLRSIPTPAWMSALPVSLYVETGGDDNLGDVYVDNVNVAEVAGPQVDLAGSSVGATTIGGAVGAPIFEDDFNRSDGALGSSWVAVEGALAISSSKVIGSLGGPDTSYYDQAVTADHWAECVVAGFSPGGSAIGPAVRINANRDCYYIWLADGSFGGGQAINITRRLSGGYTTVAGPVACPSTPFIARLEAQGTTIRAYVNGVLTLTATDSNVSTGKTGLLAGNGNTATADDWRGGDLPFVPAVYSDDFNRADGALGANWAQFDSSPVVIVSNKAVPSGSGNCGATYEMALANDQWAEGDMAVTAPPDTSLCPCVRMDNASGNCYYAWIRTTGPYIELWRRYLGGYQQLGSSVPIASGSAKVRIEAEGTTIRVYTDDVLRITETDSNVASGKAGIWAYSNNTPLPTLDNFRCGGLPYGAAAGAGIDLFVTRGLAGAANGIAATTSALGVGRPLAASAAGTSTVTSALQVARPLAASTAGGLSTVTANLTVAAAAAKTGSASVSYVETVTAAGRRTQKGSTAVDYVEALTTTGKRTPKGSNATAHTWAVAASGVKPVVGSATTSWATAASAVGVTPIVVTAGVRVLETSVERTTEGGTPRLLESFVTAPSNQGSATSTYTAATSAAGKRVPKGASTTAYVETVTAAGRKIQKGTTTTSYVETVTSAGKRTPTSTVTTTVLQALSSVGRRTPKAQATTAWTETAIAQGKRIARAVAVAAHAWAITAQGKRTARATAVVAHSWTTVAQGKRTPKASSVTAHAWSLIAQGFKPIVGVKQGSGLGYVAWALTAAGKRVPKSAVTTTFVEALTAAGKKVLRGTATTSWSTAPSTVGKRTPKATGTAAYVETPVSTGRRTPKAVATTAHAWASSATGVKPIVGVKQGTAIVGYSRVPTAAGKRTPRGVAIATYIETVVATGRRAAKAIAVAVHVWTLAAEGVRFVLGVDVALAVEAIRAVDRFDVGEMTATAPVEVGEFAPIAALDDFAAVNGVGELEASPPVAVGGLVDGMLVGDLKSAPPVAVRGFGLVASVGPILAIQGDFSVVVGALRVDSRFTLGPMRAQVFVAVGGFDLAATVADFAAVNEVGELEALPPFDVDDFIDGAVIGDLESAPPVTLVGFSPVTSVGPIREDK